MPSGSALLYCRNRLIPEADRCSRSGNRARHARPIRGTQRLFVRFAHRGEWQRLDKIDALWRMDGAFFSGTHEHRVDYHPCIAQELKSGREQ